jgi:hypothetical protein
MNPRTRQAALHAIAAVAILASLNALAHSYAGLYEWAIHHRLTGWQAFTWPAEIDVFLVIGELALYIAYLDRWPARHKVWPWTTAIVGLAVSVAGNVGHLTSTTEQAVPTVDRMTAATSPLAAFAGLAIALLVLKRTRRRQPGPSGRLTTDGSLRLLNRIPPRLMTVWRPGALTDAVSALKASDESANPRAPRPGSSTISAKVDGTTDLEPHIVRDARDLKAQHRRAGTRLSRRQLAKHLRSRGHTLANDRLPEIAEAIGLE